MTETLANGRCPECGVSRGPDDSSCHECGLLFVSNAHPHRRESDQRRRTEDLSKTSCRVCRGTIEKDAKRCLHCGEILDPAYRAARARQLRSQINYASWIAYILGFLMLFVYRPVGALAIIAGLLLSIAYYAIRIPDPDENDEQEEHASTRDGESTLTRFVRRQFGVETVRLGSKKKWGFLVAGTPLLLVLIGWTTNYSMLQIPIDRALSSSSDFPALEIAAHFEYFVLPGSVVLEIEKLGNPQDVEKALAKLADELTAKEVVLRFEDNAVRLEGKRFRELSPNEVRGLVRILAPDLEPPATTQPEPSHQVRIPIDSPPTR